MNAINYIIQQLIQVSPNPPEKEPHFSIQIKAFSGRKTNWLNITPAQFRQIEEILEKGAQ